MGVKALATLAACVALLHAFSEAASESAGSASKRAKANDVPVRARKLRSKAKETTDDDKLVITLQNDYTSSHGEPGELYAFIDSTSVVEPMQKTIFTVTAADGVTIADSACSWETPQDVRGDDIPSDDVYSDRTLSDNANGNVDESTLSYFAYIKNPGDFTISVQCTLADGTTASTTKYLRSVYVRRELRELSDDDRTKLLNAMFSLYSFETDESGQEVYGKHFHCARYFTHIHLQKAGHRNVDHMHDGLGFLTQHVALSNQFELALQTVDPSVSLPYWDFTIDSIHLRQSNADMEAMFENSEIFSSKWFGSISPDDFRILDGVFASLTIPLALEDSEVKSPYGYLRAPWNLNPSRFVTRYHKLCGSSDDSLSTVSWPTCGTHFRLTFADDYDDYYDYAWFSMYKPHGSVHTWIGGVGGGTCKSNIDALQESAASVLGDEDIIGIRTHMGSILRSMYRENAVNVDDPCDSSHEAACQFHCLRHGDYYVNFMQQLSTILEDAGISASTLDLMGPTEFKNLANSLLCTSKYWPGDQANAGSPSDPIFWPIHPTMDRLFQFKAIAKPFKSLSFDSGSFCAFPDSGCEGHHAVDLTHFEAIVYNGNLQKWESKQLTNGEMLSAIYPSEEKFSVPYIYGHFKWDHCKEEGWDFTHGHASSR